MSIKLFTLVLVNFIFWNHASATINEEDLLVWKDEIIGKFFDVCKSSMSEETRELWEDDNTYDNKETRVFTLCLMRHNRYLDFGSKVMVEPILRDLHKHVKNLEPRDEHLANVIMRICKQESDQYLMPEDVMGAWTNCMVDRAKTPEIFDSEE